MFGGRGGRPLGYCVFSPIGFKRIIFGNLCPRIQRGNLVLNPKS